MPERMTATLFDTIQESARRASNGPWDPRLLGSHGESLGPPMPGAFGRYQIVGMDLTNPHDAAFVAGSRAWVPALLEEVRQLQREVNELHAALVELRPASLPFDDDVPQRDEHGRPNTAGGSS